MTVTAESGDERSWTEFLAACDRYVAQHGSLATVEKSYVDPTGYRLGARISYYRNLHSGAKTASIPAQRRAALDDRGMIWRIAPVRDLLPDEQRALRDLTGPELGTAIVRLTDVDGVTQSSIAAALGMHRSYLNTKLKRFRETGEWPDRRRAGGQGRVAP
ncbi:Helicase associated domain protein [Streptomyces misionensis]|uniref:Helicase associated domain protein n=1 Tax=Streptomyces misionensis TaxID=67331 RepID=UPI0033FB5676